MTEIYAVFAYEGGSDKGVFLAAYHREEDAYEHKAYIDAVNNNWYCEVKYFRVFNEYTDDNRDFYGMHRTRGE